jgi:LPS O-antigen subunit length determinant protein (WzzB/FepE family)
MTETSTTRKAALWVGLVFLLGAAIGGMAGYVFAHQKYTVTNAAAPPSDAVRRAQKVRELTSLANLTPEQSQQVDAVIADIQSQMKSIRKTLEPQFDEARQKGRERIRAILTEEQKPKFEEFIQKMDEERKRNGQ